MVLTRPGFGNVNDPDSDDDGLTDGQEAEGLTTVGLVVDPGGNPVDDGIAADTSVSVDGVDPATPDSDGDGYWDGWIGVYGVGRTDNVVLYREHLRDDDDGDGVAFREGDEDDGGIEAGEPVSSQAGIHAVDADDPLTAANMTADIRGTDTPYHSNIHIGELHWRDADPSQDGDPADGSVTPNPTLNVEVDYHEDTRATPRNVLDQVEANYALYGRDVGFDADDEDSSSIVSDDISDPALAEMNGLYLDLMEDPSYENRDIDDFVYMYIMVDGTGTSLSGPADTAYSFAGDGDGAAATEGTAISLGYGIGIFDDDHTENPPRLRTEFMKTIVHEVGHHIGAGRMDDGTQAYVLPKEVYSAGNDDDTPEVVRWEEPANENGVQ